ncbi:MAG: hypothetical protein GY842_09030 [bacterium]|nr:hypothetical protein [bacterium]
MDDHTIDEGLRGVANHVSFYFTTDAQSSPTAATIYKNDSAVVVERYAYDAHGRVFATPGGDACLRTDIDCDGSFGGRSLTPPMKTGLRTAAKRRRGVGEFNELCVSHRRLRFLAGGHGASTMR